MAATGDSIRVKRKSLSTGANMAKTTVLKSSELIDFIAERISTISDWRSGFASLLNFISTRLATGGGYIRIYHCYAHRYLDPVASRGGRANSVVEGVFEDMADYRKPVAVPAEYSNYLAGEMQYSIVGIPFCKNQDYYGGLVLVGTDGEGVWEHQFQDLLAFAPYLLPLFESAVLQEILLSNYLDAVETLAVALEAKDPFARGHSNMVCAYSVAIARKMGFSDERLRSVEIGSMMHDIGKIGIPDRILLKPGGLLKEEFEIVKRHPVIGEEILKPMQHPLFTVPRKIVRWHHERMDGKGYPDGLKGEEIPLEARITFAADAYEAMTSDRPYREALSPEEAFEELACNAGSQFDPDVVDVLCDLLSPLSTTNVSHKPGCFEEDPEDDSEQDCDDESEDDSYEEWDFSEKA
jgi:HD-GYP domain-containing protein (c-di-GMP phosphodiesterase class II)